MPTDYFESFDKSHSQESITFLVLFFVLSWASIIVAAILDAIISCLRKAASASPQYARIASFDSTSDHSNPEFSTHNDHISLPMEPHLHHRSQFPTVEELLSNIVRESPARFTPDQINNLTNNCSTILGSGAYGVVFKGQTPDGIPVAVKVLTTTSKKMEEQFMAEVSTIGRTHHANLVTLYGFCFDPSMMALVYEFMENGSFSKLLFNEDREIEWEKLHEIGVKIAKGIAYLHEDCKQIIVHYDIKPDNVLLDGDLNPKVADFGLAKLYDREISRVEMSGGRGTMGYSAPEIWHRNFPVTHKCDVYSFGIMLFEIVGRRRHFDEHVTESPQWLPKWAWDMYKNSELDVMLSLCGVEEKHRKKARRMCVVGLLCVQKSPYARPLMSDVVKMLEGRMEIPHMPQNPFEHLETLPENPSTMDSDADSSMSGFRIGRVMSQIIRPENRQEITEIELVTR